ncbi:PREDICTED: auxin-responsive protein IAA27-like isoform X2 [Ipomoea nil]|uniref:auxin-responsive protein IAA27-like isoform X2 n=1 Tax=Ipomoea nil TaxID=35883 RepID=UPI000901ADFE|nr:PREDICTED: auxin-responsive protein IAA27-like isoform X2 [Ipomoea nil]
MSVPLEHDYIGLSEASSMERSSEKISSSGSSSTVCTEVEESNDLNLKETELRLGLPGSESPERKAGAAGAGVCLFGKDLEDRSVGFSPLKNFVSGAKRGFSDAIDGSGKWNLSMNGGSESDWGNTDVLFSLKGGNPGPKDTKTCLPAGPPMKEVAPPPPKPAEENKPSPINENVGAPAPKAQVVGWPPVRSFRKNTLASNVKKNNDVEAKPGPGCIFVKVSLEGAPYLRKVDLKSYANYSELSSALQKMFGCFTVGQCSSDGFPGRKKLDETNLIDLTSGSEYVLTYEDKDGDWMLVGDVPWEMFTESCKKLRIMKSADAIGLAPRAAQKFKIEK